MQVNREKTYETFVTPRTHDQPSHQQIDKRKPSHKQITPNTCLQHVYNGRRPVAMQTIVSTLLLFVCSIG
jgi:hypothetical protein